MKSKQELRKEMLQIRDAISEEERHRYSEEITKRILQSKVYNDADVILSYVSFRSEVETMDIIQQALTDQKEVYVPKIIEMPRLGGANEKRMEFYQIESLEWLREGVWGMLEPDASEERRYSNYQDGKIQREKRRVLIRLPGVAFDIKGNRIGYGGGFYDRYLSQLEEVLGERVKNCLSKIALAFECQVSKTAFPKIELHDVAIDGIVTENEFYEI